MNIIYTILFSVFTAFLGYLFGSMKNFIEQKQKAYIEALPIFIKIAYDENVNPEQDQDELSKSIMKMWLYASKSVAIKIDKALSILIKPERGNKTEAFQEAIVAMIKDIQVFPWQNLKPEEVKHLYLTIKTG